MTYYTVQEFRFDGCFRDKDISHYETIFSSASTKSICEFLNGLTDKGTRFIYVVEQEFDKPYRTANRGVEDWDWCWWEFLE